MRLLAAGDRNKNDPNDARSVAVASLRAPAIKPKTGGQSGGDEAVGETPPGPATGPDLAGAPAAALLCEMAPRGGSPRTQGKQGKQRLDGIDAEGAVAAAWVELAEAFIDDLHRIDEQIRDTA